jgi:hypothetical protein
MTATTGHSINTGPYGENTEICSSLKLLHWLNLNCASIIWRSFTNFVFFILIGIPRWLPLQDIDLHRTNCLRASGILFKINSTEIEKCSSL